MSILDASIIALAALLVSGLVLLWAILRDGGED